MKLKHLLASILVVIPLLVSAQSVANVNQGGTGLNAVPNNNVLLGSSTLRLQSVSTSTFSTLMNILGQARASISNTITGITYDSNTGIFSLTAGYNIPLTASTTNWNNFWNTPSTRITAGTNLSWSGNTLNATGGSGSFSTTSINGLATTTFTFATSSDTNLGLTIATSTTGITFTPVWIGTLADGRIASASTWNAKLGQFFSVASGSALTIGNLFSTSTLTVFGKFNDSTNASGTSGQVLQSTGTSTLWTTLAGGGITSLNGLSASTQTFASSSAGTDFGIISSGSVHTFQWPSATASVRGLLTSTDWSTFNNKAPTASPTFTGTATFANSTTTNATSSNLTSNVALFVKGLFFDSTNASGTVNMILRSTGTSTQWVATSSLFGPITTYTGTYPVIVTGSVISSGFSTSTINNFSAQNNFSTASSSAHTVGNLFATSSLTIFGTLRDSLNASGTLGMFLQSTGTSTQWLATSTLNIPTGLTGGVNGKDAYWTGTNTLGVGNMFMNGTVAGINATSSTVLFTIQGASGSTNDLFRVASSSATAPITLSADSKGNIYVGTSTQNPIPSLVTVEVGSTTVNTGINLAGWVNGYLQTNVQNRSTSTVAESNWSITSDVGNNTNSFLAGGINNSGFNSTSTYSTGSALDTNIISLANDMYITNASTTGGNMIFQTGGTGTSTSATNRMRIATKGAISIATSSIAFGLNVATTTNITATTTLVDTTIVGKLNHSGNTATLATTTVNGSLSLTGRFLPRLPLGYTSSASTTFNSDNSDVATSTISATTTIMNFSGSTPYDSQIMFLNLMATTTQGLYWGTPGSSNFGSTTAPSVPYPTQIASGTTQMILYWDAFRSKWWLSGLQSGLNN